ncbi:MAG: signal peptidase II [Spirochaetales bacterium]
MLKSYFKKIGIILLIVALDQVTKSFLDGENFSVIDSVLSFVSAHNTGAAWSIFEGQLLVFIIGAILFIIAMFVFDYFERGKGGFYTIGFSLIIAGSLGNLIDRIAFGYVRDFIAIDFVRFPVFNIADMSLVIGVILFMIYVFFIEGKKKAVK